MHSVLSMPVFPFCSDIFFSILLIWNRPLCNKRQMSGLVQWGKAWTQAFLFYFKKGWIYLFTTYFRTTIYAWLLQGVIWVYSLFTKIQIHCFETMVCHFGKNKSIIWQYFLFNSVILIVRCQNWIYFRPCQRLIGNKSLTTRIITPF